MYPIPSTLSMGAGCGIHVAHGGGLDDVGQLPGRDRVHLENRGTVSTRVRHTSVRVGHTCACLLDTRGSYKKWELR